ncbi:MAG: Crp/Fnr family transcriptional regulator [Deltaproteobacteria bacterium]|nr:Crp/Fnr family transcriptional regulator [Deltaproteobacteria bacterium]
MKPTPLEKTALYKIFRPWIEQLRPFLKPRKFEEGRYLYHESEPAERFWTVRSGEVRTLKASASGRVITLETLHAGDPFGMAALRADAVYTESAQAITACEAWCVPRRVVVSLMAKDPEVSRALLAIVAGRLQRAHDRLCSFAHDSVAARMARTLLDSADDERIETTRRVLGESAGTTVETAIRVLRRFEKARWIEGGVGWVRILDRPALENIARGGEDVDD